MRPTDKISVLICAHSQDGDHDNMLARALESLARQTRYPDEVVVVLDECRPETRGYVDGYEGVFESLSVFERPKKLGLAWAKNFGIEKCTGDWIAYLDADDMWMDCKLEVQCQYMIDRPQIDFCGTESWDLDPKAQVLRPNCFAVGQYRTHKEIIRRLPHENILCHGSMMIRRAAFSTLNGYRTDRNVHGCEDWDMWKRAVASNFTFGKVPERLYVWSAGTSVVRGETV